MKKRGVTVTQDGVVKSQPGVSVSVRTGSHLDGAVLSAKRHYQSLRNSLGGFGRFKSLDGDGLVFASSSEAWDYAYSHGYVRDYFTAPNLRCSRVAAGRRP